jgi:hypothetical protein
MRTDQASTLDVAPPRMFVEPPSRPRRPWIVVAIVAAISLFALVAMAYAWRSDVGEAEHARDTAVQQVAALSATVDRLEEQLGTQVPGLETRLEAARDALREARAELTELVGPSLPDGRHFVRVAAVGDDQDPPRLIVDLQQWFTNQAAVEAALEDGVHPAEAGINGYYIRNENPRWRILEVDPEAPVALTSYPYGQIDDPAMVDLGRLGSLLDGTEMDLRLPYWITVRDGVVVRIHEQYLP